MAFEIQEKPFGEINQFFLVNTVTQEYAAVLPAYGAIINQVALKKGDQLYELLDGSPSFEYLITEGKTSFKGSKLFPFPNRIQDGKYSFGHSVFQLPINFPKENNAIHGLVLEQKFTIVEKEVTESSARLRIRFETDVNTTGYPFKSVLTIEYRLSSDGFSCTTEVQNIDSKSIPVGDGWHPYFKTGSRMDDCTLSLPVSSSFDVNERMIPTGSEKKEIQFNKPTKIGLTKFDTGYRLMESDQDKLTTRIEDPTKNLAIMVWQTVGINQYNFLQVYIPPHRLSIAIEPMTCLTDTFNNGCGLITLPSGASTSFTFGIKIE